MNRRQEVAAWVFVLLLAGPRLVEALEYSEPLQHMFHPLLVIAPMAVYSLRTRTQPPPLPEAARRGGIVAMLAVLVAGAVTLASDHLDSLDVSAELEDKADASSVSDLEAQLEDLKREVDTLSFAAGSRYR